MDDGAARERIARVEQLLGELEELPDPAARDKALEAIGALLDLYGEGLDRLIARVAERDDGALAAALAGDEVVSHLLLLHGLHPVSTEQRVRAALEEVRPYLESHGGDVGLLEVTGGAVRLQLEGSCSGCPSSMMTLKLAIEDAIHKAAPEIESVEAEGAAEVAAPQLLQIEVPATANGGDAGDAWQVAGAARDLGGARPSIERVGREELVFLRAQGALYAYRPRCPGCGEPLAGASLAGEVLTCAGCGNRFDVVHAGVGLDSTELRLEPVPLLVDPEGLVKVAAATAA